MTASNYRFKRYKNIEVAYLPHLDGGGSGFGQYYIPVVRDLFGKVDRVYEFCAGPAFIGFSLLAHGLCNSLCLSDINPDAVEVVKETVRRNQLEDRVSVYLSDGLDQIPDSERWDLVVGNPPHFHQEYKESIRHHDPDWIIHKNFYSSVGQFLKPEGSVLLQENYEGSNESDFEPMLAAEGLEFLEAFMYGNAAQKDYFDTYYYIWSRLKSNQPQPQIEALARLPFISSRVPVQTVSINLSADRASTIELKKLQRYRFVFANHGEREVDLAIYAKKFKLIPRFVRGFGKIPPEKNYSSFVFNFSQGEYIFQDRQTKKDLCYIVAV